MIQHKNDLNPGPLTVSGFKGGSCDQANWPDNNRTLLKATVKGQHRLRVQPGDTFRFRNQTMSGNTSTGKFKNELLTFARFPDIMKLYPGNKLSGLDYSPVTTEFTTESDGLATCLEKTGTIAINAVRCRYKPCEEVESIYHGKTLKSSYIAGNNPSGIFALKMSGSNKAGKTPLQRRKTNQLNWLAKLLNWQEYPAEFDLKSCTKLDNN